MCCELDFETTTPPQLMQLIDLVSYFRQGGTFEGFCTTHSLNSEAEVIEIYAQEPVSLESSLGFFPVEETYPCGQPRLCEGVKG